MKSWQVIEFEIEQAYEELASWLMIQLGSNGCQIQPSASSYVQVSAIFEEISCSSFVELRKALKQYGLEEHLKNLRTTTIADDDWLKKWKEGLRPIRIGKFIVSPPWHSEQAQSENPDALFIDIEPGMAFGTGLHATTQYCLLALEDYLTESPRGTQAIDILDVGTGSGILAIAAAKLNKNTKITAVDINPTCIEVAQQNVQLNNVQDSVILKTGSTETCSNLSFDCIVANVSYEDISKLLLEFLRLLRPEGQIVLAGILAEKLKLLECDIESYPLTIADQKLDGEWIGVTLKRIGVVLKPAASRALAG